MRAVNNRDKISSCFSTGKDSVACRGEKVINCIPMNYLAHLFLSQPNGPSYIGNLMGDFMRGVKKEELPVQVRLGAENHFAVDRFTDRHPLIRELKMLFRPEYRRGSGIAVDIAFDHFLTLHWNKFGTESFEVFESGVYLEITKHEELMHPAMSRYIRMLIRSNWLSGYGTLSGVQFVMERLGDRVAVPNRIGESFSEIERLYGYMETVFLDFFPELHAHIEKLGIENANTDNGLRTA